MHLGNAFSALLCWLSVRSRGGRLVLRMENLDPLRTTPQFAAGILEDLDWLGLDWDTRAPDQQHRTGFYHAQVAKLDALGLTYPCFCSRAQLHAASAPHAGDNTYVYNGRCRTLTPEEAAEKQKQRGAALRVRVPNLTIALEDGLQGHYEENLARDCGDFILRRSDGVYAYQLAAPADDGDAGITEVVRGRDLLSSAPRQMWLMQTLGYTPPRYIHLPLLLAPDGRRLAKRDADLDLGALRARLKSPQRLIGALAHRCGLIEKEEPLPAPALLAGFSWEKVQKEDIIINGEEFLK